MFMSIDQLMQSPHFLILALHLYNFPWHDELACIIRLEQLLTGHRTPTAPAAANNNKVLSIVHPFSFHLFLFSSVHTVYLFSFFSPRVVVVVVELGLASSVNGQVQPIASARCARVNGIARWMTSRYSAVNKQQFTSCIQLLWRSTQIRTIATIYISWS